MTTIAELMRDAPLFADMRSDRLQLLAGCGQNVQFREGETLFREGDAADVVRLLRTKPRRRPTQRPSYRSTRPAPPSTTRTCPVM